MKKRIIALIIGVALLLLCGFLTAIGSLIGAISSEGMGGEAIFGDNVTLRRDETIDNDLVVMGGNFTMEEQSKVKGDLALFGGNVESQGSIDGDVAIFGGNLTLGSKAKVSGDIAVIGGNANVNEDALVTGRIHTTGGNLHRYKGGQKDNSAVAENDSSAKPTVSANPSHRQDDDDDDDNDDDDDDDGYSHYSGGNWSDGQYHRDSGRGFFGSIFHFVGNLLGAAMMTAVLVGIAFLVATFVPEQMKQVGDTAADEWLLSLGVGSATLFVSALLVVAICLLFPVLIWFAVAVATLFGWIAIGQLIGERVLIALEQPYSSFVASTITGVVVLSIIMHVPELLGPLWCIGGLLALTAVLVTFVVMAIGLGAVILTRFGTQSYPTVSLTKQPII